MRFVFLLGLLGLGFPKKFSLNEIRKYERTRFVQNFHEFRCIFDKVFDLIFAKYFHFRVIFVQFSFDKNQNFSMSQQEDCFFLRKKKILQERSKIVTNFAKISNEFC